MKSLKIKTVFILVALLAVISTGYFAVYAAQIIIGGSSAGLGITDGLIGHWTFDGPDMQWSSAGAEVRDVSGNGNHGSLEGGMGSHSAVIGKIGQALSFDGVSDKVDISFPSNEVDSISQITVSFWIKTTGETQEKFRGILQKGDPNGYEDFGIAMGHDGTGAGSAMPGHVGVYFVTNLGSSGNNYTTSAVDDGNWHHITWTWRSSDGARRIYLDGSLDNQGTRSGSNLQNTDNVMRFGSYKSSYGANFDGGIDDVRIYSRALSEAEVQELYRQGAGRLFIMPTGLE